MKELFIRFDNFNKGKDRPLTKVVDAFGKTTEVEDVRHSADWWKQNHMTIVYTILYYPLRLFYISVYYYIFPFSVILVAYFVSFYTNYNQLAIAKGESD